MKKTIYLDNNATTIIDPAVLNSFTSTLQEKYGNPSSVHSIGMESRKLLSQARSDVANAFQVLPQEIIFTSSGTEAINMVIKGFCALHPIGHIITSNAEHSATYSTLKAMEKLGWEITYLPVGLHGGLSAKQVQDSIKSNTRLIALMAVNNETGVKTEIEVIAEIAEENSIPFFVDAVAQLGKEEIVIFPGISAICFSGHKIHAPKGVGAAFIRKSLKLDSIITGGDQEFGRRSGTENVAGIVAFAQAVKLSKELLKDSVRKMTHLRDKFEKALLDLPNVSINGTGPRVCNTSNLCFQGIAGDELLLLLDQAGIAASHGSACSSGALEPSRVLLNMGIPLKDARSSLRFSLSRFTTEEEIELAIQIIKDILSKNFLSY